jgi:hypothetical protein
MSQGRLLRLGSLYVPLVALAIHAIAPDSQDLASNRVLRPFALRSTEARHALAVACKKPFSSNMAGTNRAQPDIHES